MSGIEREASGQGLEGGGPVLVSDFDGTMTRLDFYQRARARWWDLAQGDPWEDYLAGRLTHFEALNRFFARVRGSEAELRQFIDGMELDPAVPEALERLVRAGWRIVIASAGCEWYIRHLLRQVRVPVALYANPGRYDPERGLEMTLPESSPFFIRSTGIDKVAVTRAAMAGGALTAFAGDGPPDLPAARLVPARLRFARGYLAQALDKAGEGYHPLENWAGLADTLLRETRA